MKRGKTVQAGSENNNAAWFADNGTEQVPTESYRETQNIGA